MSKKVKKTTTTVVEEIIETNNVTEIVAVLDRSGSMSRIIDDAVGGFNTFIKEQKEEDIPTKVTVALFDDTYELIHDDLDLKDVEELTNKIWSPQGMTALNDAIGKTINLVANRHKKMKKSQRPDKVLVAIVTDGMENASKEYTSSQIKDLIKQKEKENWQFVYLAANQDAFAVGTSYGFSGGNTLTFDATGTGVSSFAFGSLSKASKNYRIVTTNSAIYNAAVTNLMADVISENDSEYEKD